MLDSYISKHVNKELRVTVVDLHGNVLFDSSQNDSHEPDNHIKRPEVQKALKDGKGYDLRRISETTGKTYFYSATAYEGCIIRSALPLQRQPDEQSGCRPTLHLVHGHCITVADIRLLQIHLQSRAAPSTTCASLPKGPTRTNP
ncbi:hypothetical protein NXX09_13770 [Bacteroides uniformis]|nr:hypothetical protein [Bacteroides uniformis]